MNYEDLIPILVIVILILVVALVLKSRKNTSIKITRFKNITEEQLTDLLQGHSTSENMPNNNNLTTKKYQNITESQLKDILKEHNLPDNIFKSNNSTYTTSKTFHKVKYVNGEKVSEETKSSHNEITPMTNCPNCGAKIENDSNGVCHYCNTSFKNYQTIQK